MLDGRGPDFRVEHRALPVPLAAPVLGGSTLESVFGQGVDGAAVLGRECFDLAPPLLDLLWVLPVAVGCCLAGAVAPAIRAATLDPVDCLLGSRMQ